MKAEKEWVPFKENYIFITLFVHVVIGFLVSFMPEENVVKWLIINLSIAILSAILSYIIWIFQKHNSKRYFSLHSFVMLMVIVYYAMSPAFKALYPTIFFWLLLIVTIGLISFLLFKQDAITRALVNPREMWFKNLLFIYIGIILFIGGIMWAYIIAFDAGPFIGVAIIFYFIGLLMMMIAPAMLSTPERVKQLEQ
ncbi:hypothetical protein [Lysinibacillus telephonicus]|uniref:Uncharacterized protein n=1 Tax=Lysinibacillus telephonicus TaxID=1714840 RepID=A0A431UUE2_9BACI|nr:hypothetical protein [Lysinibacillus telephonicus]RTQ94048.1 hypothetical protein EKG35_07005 [Lysinibacillus telephonicus]